jgi:hypothetical protein
MDVDVGNCDGAIAGVGAGMIRGGGAAQPTRVKAMATATDTMRLTIMPSVSATAVKVQLTRHRPDALVDHPAHFAQAHLEFRVGVIS